MYSIYTTEVFDKWFSKLKDQQAKKRIQVRIDRVEDGNFGDSEPIGEGVSELRFFFWSWLSSLLLSARAKSDYSTSGWR